MKKKVKLTVVKLLPICFSAIYSLSSFYIKIKRRMYIHYNRWYFHKCGVKFGEGLTVLNRIYLRGEGKIIIGNKFTFTSGDCFNPICRNIRGCINTVKDGIVRIGDGVGISSATIWAQKEIIIGNYVNIGGNCLLIDNDAHPLNYIERRDPPFKGNVLASPIIIEDDVWIGANCIILKGVKIGARSIVGAGSVVTKSIPKDSVVAGNPAKIIRKNEIFDNYN